jgi:hypothetical protein
MVVAYAGVNANVIPMDKEKMEAPKLSRMFIPIENSKLFSGRGATLLSRDSI